MLIEQNREVLEGEIISPQRLPATVISVRFRPNPFKRSALITTHLFQGGTLEHIIKLSVRIEYYPYLRAFINGHEIERVYWHLVRPKTGMVVYLVVAPEDPISASIAIASIAAGAATSGAIAAGGIAALGIVGGTLGAAVAGAVAGALVSTAIQFLGSAIFAPRSPSNAISSRNRDEGRSQTFSITGARNQANRYAPVPVVLGTHKFVPSYGAAPYTEISGNDEFLRVLLVWGYGPVQVEDIRIGNTPLESFDDVEVEHDFTGTSTGLNLFPSTAEQQNLNIPLTSTPAVIRTEIDVDEFGITVTFPAGLVTVDPDQRHGGFNLVRNHFGVTIERKLANEPNSAYVLVANVIIHDKIRELVRRSFRYQVPRGTYDIRVSGFKGSKDGDHSQLPDRFRGQPRFIVADHENGTTQDDGFWTALRSFQRVDPIRLRGVAKSVIRVRASDQLNNIIDQFNAVVSTLIPTWNSQTNTWGGSRVSSNPAAIIRYLLTGAPNANRIPTTQVDNANLGEFYEFCEAEGFTFDQVIDFRASVRELMTNVAAAGRGSPQLIDGRWGVIIERPQTTVVQSFTPKNSWNFSSNIFFVEIPDAFRVRFLNSARGYEEDERIVYRAGITAADAETFQVLELPGQVNSNNVYKLARYALAGIQLRPEYFSWTCDIENLIVTRGDLVRLTNDVAFIGLAYGRILEITLIAVTAFRVTLDEVINVNPNQSYVIRIRLSGGVIRAFPVINYPSTSTNQFDISNISGMAISVGDLYQFGTSDQDSVELIVTEIIPGDNLTAEITAVPYSDDLYSTENIPNYETQISIPISASLRGPAPPRVINVTSDQQALRRASDGTVELGILVHFEAVGSLIGGTTLATHIAGRFRRSDTTQWIYTELSENVVGSFYLTPVELGEEYQIELRALDRFSGVSDWIRTENHIVLGFTGPPPSVTNFTVEVLQGYSRLEWLYLNPPSNLASFELRYSPQLNVTRWESMTPVNAVILGTARNTIAPTITGSYGIKAVTRTGVKSLEAAFANSPFTDPEPTNLTETISLLPGSTNFTSAVNIHESGGRFTLQDLTVQESTIRFPSQPLDLGEEYTPTVTTEIITDVIGSAGNFISDWSRLSDVQSLSQSRVNSDEVEVTVEIFSGNNLTTVRNARSEDFQPFVIGAYTGRYFSFQLRIVSRDSNVRPVVNSVRVFLNEVSRTAQGTGVVTSSGFLDITFSPSFRALQTLSIEFEDTTVRYEVRNRTRTGFRLVLPFGLPFGQTRSFDYQAIGYGREVNT